MVIRSRDYTSLRQIHVSVSNLPGVWSVYLVGWLIIVVFLVVYLIVMTLTLWR